MTKRTKIILLYLTSIVISTTILYYLVALSIGFINFITKFLR